MTVNHASRTSQADEVPRNKFSLRMKSLFSKSTNPTITPLTSLPPHPPLTHKPSLLSRFSSDSVYQVPHPSAYPPFGDITSKTLPKSKPAFLHPASKVFKSKSKSKKGSIEVEEPFNPEAWRYIHPALRPRDHIFRVGVVDTPAFSPVYRSYSINDPSASTPSLRTGAEAERVTAAGVTAAGVAAPRFEGTTILGTQILEDIFASSHSTATSSPSYLNLTSASPFDQAGERNFKLYQENLKKKKRNAGVWTDWDDWEEIDDDDEDEDVDDDTNGEGEREEISDEDEDEDDEGEDEAVEEYGGWESENDDDEDYDSSSSYSSKEGIEASSSSSSSAEESIHLA